MSSMLHWFTSPEWAQVVKALLHSLWQGALIAVVLAIFLRRFSNPVTRYRSALAALALIIFASVVTWAIINAASHRPALSSGAPALVAQSLAPDPVATPEPHSISKTVVILRNKTSDLRWTAWLAVAWLAGASLMLARAAFKVAGAEQLCRSCRPLNDARIEALLAETRRALGIANQIRVGVTDKLTSPAVVGIVVPMLILPLSLLTTLTPEQIHFILLHELAHIRRRDYLANLIQFVAESLLFFNPAVWWISHQIRREREACCDALATELSGAPGDYAQTLVRVAEKILTPAPAAAPAFGNRREPSALAERIQRLLVPGYRPSLRLTWRAMLGALVLGSILLFSSAVGTRLTVAAVLTDRQATNGVVSNTLSPATQTHDDTNNTDANPQRQKIIKKLNEITFDKVSFPNIQLREVVGTLTEQVKRRDHTHQGVHFILDDNPSSTTSSLKPGDVWIALYPAVTNGTLLDLLEAIVKTAERPITFSVADDGVHFSFPALPSSELSTRTFNIGLYEVQQLSQSDIPIRPRDFRAGDVLVQWLSDNHIYIYPPKGLSFDDQQGVLTVHATPGELDGINRLVDKVNAVSKLVEDGKLLFERGKLDEAEAKFEEALHVFPNDQRANYYFNLISERRAEAKRENLNQTNTNPPAASAPSEMTSPAGTHDAEEVEAAQLVQDGKLLFQTGKMDDAEAKLKEALDRDPDNQAARYYLSLIKQLRANKEMDARNLKNDNPAHNLPNPNPHAHGNTIYTSAGRQKVYEKLNGIFFDKIAFPDLPLSEVVRILAEQVETRDPEREGINFVINKVKPSVPPSSIPGQPTFDPATGQPIAPAAPADEVDLGDVRISLDPGLKNVRLMDVLEAIVRTADHPIKYSMLDYGVEFSFKGGETPELFTRTFKVDPNTFFMGLQNVGSLNFGTTSSGRGGASGNGSTTIPHVDVTGGSTAGNRGLRYVSAPNATIDIQTAVINFFDAIGVKLYPPKSIFFNDRQGTLTVHATAPDLDLIEAAVDTLNIAPPEVTIKARFVQLRHDSTWPTELGWFADAVATNDGHSFTFSLAPSQFQTVLKELRDRRGADLLNEGEVTTLSGRQAQFQVLEVDTIADDTNGTSSISNSTGSASTKIDPEHIPFGTTLDVVANVSADGSTIQMTLIPTVTERIKHEPPGNSVLMGTNVAPVTSLGMLPGPHVRVWQVTTNCMVRDGQTLVIGGMPSQIGSGPFSTSTNMLVFVTATLIDPAGNRIHSDDYYDGGPGFPGSGGGGGFGGGGFGGGR